MKFLRTPLQGMIIGSSMLIPGLSGGTMAIIIGIYDELIHAISHFGENRRQHFFFLLRFLIGSILGIVFFSKLVLLILETYQIPVTFFFIGIIIGSIPSLYEKAKIRRWKPSHFIFAGGGFLLAYSIQFLPSDFLKGDSLPAPAQFLLLLAAGILISIALILPGISTSHMLLILGIYETVLDAINQFNLFYLLPLVIGTIGGILLGTRGLESLMTRFPEQTYCTIIGFVVSSVFDLIPPRPHGIEILISILTFLIGAVGIFWFTRHFKQKEG
jgi:putative membrane protein